MSTPIRYVAKDGSVSYRVRYRDGGKQTSATFRGELAQQRAEAFARMLETQCGSGPRALSRRRPPASSHQGLSVKPLAAMVLVRGGVRSCLAGLPASEAQRLERRFHRAMQAGRLKPDAADELAVKLVGLTPIEIWGDGYL